MEVISFFMLNGGRISDGNFIVWDFCKYLTEIGPKLASQITSESEACI